MLIILSCKVVPNASVSKIIRRSNGQIVCYVAAPALDNKANEALILLIAALLKISRRFVSIKSGFTTRNKVIQIETNVAYHQVLEALGLEPAVQGVL